MPGERGELRYRFVGRREDGEHLPGVPATNLYDDNLALLDADQKKAVERSAIYKRVEEEPVAAPASQDKTAVVSPAPRGQPAAGKGGESR